MNQERKRSIEIDENCEYVKGLLTKGTEAENKDNIIRQARRSKIDVMSQINKLEDSIDLLYDQVDAEKKKLPINIENILNAEDEIALADRRLTKAKELFKSLFGEDLNPRV